MALCGFLLFINKSGNSKGGKEWVSVTHSDKLPEEVFSLSIVDTGPLSVLGFKHCSSMAEWSPCQYLAREFDLAEFT